MVFTTVNMSVFILAGVRISAKNAMRPALVSLSEFNFSYIIF